MDGCGTGRDTVRMNPSVSLRTLLLPREHGSWSLAFEPVALGLLVAPSWAGGALAGAVAAGFFTRRPLKLAVTLPATDARQSPARTWAVGLGLLAGNALFLSAHLSPASARDGWALWPLLLAVPFGALFLRFDLRNAMREAEAELAGSAAFALVPAAFATLAGWPALHALGLSAVMLARSVPTVLAVRTALRLGKGDPVEPAWPLFAAAGAAFALALLAARGWVPRTAPVVALLWLARTFLYAVPTLRPPWSAKRIGLTETLLGLASLAALAAAYRL